MGIAWGIGRLAAVQTELVDAAVGVAMAMSLDMVLVAGAMADPNDPEVMEAWARFRGPGWSRAVLAVSGAAGALALRAWLPPDVFWRLVAPLDGTRILR